MARRTTAYVSDSGIAFVRLPSGRYEAHHHGERYDLELRHSSRHEPGGDGWHLYGGGHFGKQLSTVLAEAVEGAARVIERNAR